MYKQPDFYKFTEDSIFLAEIAANHVVASVNFSTYIAGFLPALETVGETTLQFARVRDGGGNQFLRIVLDPSDPNNLNVGLVAVDTQAGNGVIHEVDAFIEF
jgi:hypothetical protein